VTEFGDAETRRHEFLSWRRRRWFYLALAGESVLLGREMIESVPAEGTAQAAEGMECAYHPGVLTHLRCNKCGKPICARCAIHTPVGYRCKECVRQQQAVYYTAFRLRHYVTAGLVTLPLALIAGWIVPSLGWFYAIILGPVAGAAIAGVAEWAVKHRRGRYMWLVVCGSIVLGTVPHVLMGSPWIGTLDLAQDLLYVALAVGVACARLRDGSRIV